MFGMYKSKVKAEILYDLGRYEDSIGMKGAALDFYIAGEPEYKQALNLAKALQKAGFNNFAQDTNIEIAKSLLETIAGADILYNKGNKAMAGTAMNQIKIGKNGLEPVVRIAAEIIIKNSIKEVLSPEEIGTYVKILSYGVINFLLLPNQQNQIEKISRDLV